MVEMVTIEVDTIKRAIVGCLASNDLVREVYPYLGDPVQYDLLRGAIREASFVVSSLEDDLAEARRKAPATSPAADLDFYKGLHKQQAETITRLQGEVDSVNANLDTLCFEHGRKIAELILAREERDEARARATHAEEALAAQCEMHEGILAQRDLRDSLIETQRDALIDMQERATNAEYNAKHYWRELQAETNKAHMLAATRSGCATDADGICKYKQERDGHVCRSMSSTNAAVGG
jgi:chromosome segregation ATPase